MEIEISKVYYDNGNLRFETPHLKNVKHGIQKLYYPNEQIQSMYQFKYGTWFGINQYWNLNRSLSLVQYLINNQFSGPKIVFRYGN